MAKIISLANHKGGVGKTCSSVNLGAGLSKQGKQVLLIDLDPQSNLSLCLGVKDPKFSIYEALSGKLALKDIIVKVAANLDVAPASLDLSGAEVELVGEAGRELILKELIQPVKKDYDYILIDCPPSLGLLTLNALTASDEVYIPLQAQFLATQGLVKLNEIISIVKKKLNKKLNVGGVFLTQFDSRKVLNRDVATTVENFFKEKVFKTRIRDNIALGEAPSAGVDIFRYNPKSSGAEDYHNLTLEVLERNK